MACVSGGGATCSQSPFRQAVQFEQALTSKQTCGSTLTLGITQSEGGLICLFIYIWALNFHCDALFCA